VVADLRAPKNVFKKMLTAERFLLNISVLDISINMIKASLKPENMPPLTPAVFHVLLALADGERHGYAVMREVAESTEGRIKMGPGTLYGTIKRLLEAQLIEESDERPDPHLDDERRRYYRLTAIGEQVVRAEARRYSDMVALARRKKIIGKTAMAVLPSGCQ
jgi:DNA-binding PadR family transcriptional regulator